MLVSIVIKGGTGDLGHQALKEEMHSFLAECD